MGTSIERHLSPAEVAQLQATKESAERMSSGTTPGKFAFFVAFDGTNNDKYNLPQVNPPLLDTTHQTNIANLHDQAKVNESDTFKVSYYPGVGTGGDRGNWINASVFPPSRFARRRAKHFMSSQSKPATT
ncbi:MAG: hypothetical protein JSS14_16165 [Proteobacteria bacterium]|nr:hypothetical protein [Pseudomonadota bacterium]